LEEIIDVTRAEAKRLNDAVLQAEKDNPGEAALVVVEFDGQRISLQDLSARRNSYAGALAEMEQSWFDWRQQYFLEYAQSYNALNLGQVSLTLQRRMKTFRTMGIVQAQKALIAWKNAEIARAGAEQAQAFVEGTNKFIQSAATAGSDATIAAARAAQTPLVSEETVFVVYDSLRRSAEGMLAADTWGREQRAKINSAMQTGEAAIQTTFSATRSALIKNALKELGEPLDAPPAEDKSGEEILTLLATSAK
jgi:hypothetical protein